MTSVVDCIKRMVGKPYKWGGDTPVGFDCTGLLSYCFTKCGTSLFHHTAGDLLTHCEVVNRKPSVGDLVFRRRFSESVGEEIVDHVGLVVDENKVVSSWRTRGVTLDSLNSEFNIVATLKKNYKAPTKGNYLSKQPSYSKDREILRKELEVT